MKKSSVLSYSASAIFIGAFFFLASPEKVAIALTASALLGYSALTCAKREEMKAVRNK